MLGNIVERSNDAPSAPSAPRAPTSSFAGFPTIVHRSQKLKRPCAFAAASARQARDTGVGRAVEFADIPNISNSLQSTQLDSQPEAGPSTPRAVKEKENEYLRVQREIGDENVRKVAEMSTEEREEEVRELEERFGSGVLAALRKRAEKRAGSGVQSTEQSSVPGVERHLPGGILGQTAKDPRHEATTGKKSVKFTSPAPPPDADLKSTYFANTPAEPDKLAWMTSSSDSSTGIRFDLSGQLHTPSQQTDLPTHLGLHHHGDQPDMAGYTIGEILLLCRSTVPAQRVGMMGLLGKVIGAYVLSAESDDVRRICAEGKVCEKAVSLCVDVLHSTRNVTLLQVVIELLYNALGGPTWAFLETTFRPGPDAEGRAASIASVAFEDLLHRLSELLNTPDYLPAISIHHLILILRRASTSNRETAETILPLLPPLLQTHVTRRPWPAQSGKLPFIEPLRLMADLIASSRLCATEIVDAGLPGSILRFCVVSTWSEDPLGADLCIEVLRIFGSLARYGLSAGTARTAHDIWVVLAQVRNSQLAEAYFVMLEGWTTCAIDPHRTTPEHDLTWTQISGLGWAEEALRTIETFEEQTEMALSAAMRLLVAWTVGLGVNGVKGGEDEKAEMRKRLMESGIGKALHECVLGGTGADDQLVLNALRLQGHLATPSDTSTEPFSLFDADDLSTLPGLCSNRLMQYELIRSALEDAPGIHVHQAFKLLPNFQPGEEPLALELLDHLLKLDWSTAFPSLASLIKGIEHPDTITLLRPLFQHAILPILTDITAPSQIHHLHLKATGTLLSSSPSPNETGRYSPGLPLRQDWLFHPIDELLHSADSTAFQQSPIDWTPTEMEIVRATMVLIRLAMASGYELDRSALIFGLMKVYMLEHQTGGMVDTGESEIFRDNVVRGCIESLMINSSSSTTTPNANLETAAIPFLGLEPFYHLYTDLVSLFENASFGDATFARILLPPLAMSYPSDYRKIVWSNPNVIRLIRTQLKDVPLERVDGLKVFFEPIERDPEVLSAYGQAVVRGWVKPTQGFLWEVAIYHLRVFFGQEGTDPVEEKISAGEKERRVALGRLRKGLKDAVMRSGNEAVIAALRTQVQPWK